MPRQGGSWCSVVWCGAGEAVLVEQCTSRGYPHARGFLCLWLAQPIRAVTWGTAPLALKPMAKCHFASAAAGWALLCDLMQNTKEMESTGMRCEALCIPIHLRIVYVLILLPFKSLFGCCCLLEGQSWGFSKPWCYSMQSVLCFESDLGSWGKVLLVYGQGNGVSSSGRSSCSQL